MSRPALGRLVVSVAVTAVLGLGSAGCSDDKGSSAERPTSSPTLPVPPPSTATESAVSSPPPASGAEPSSPAASTKPASTRAPSATSAKPTTASAKPSTSAPAGGPAAKFQGAWYYAKRDANGSLLTLTVNGGTISVAMNGDSCSGRISASAYVTMTCKGDTGQGQASVSGDGETLTIAWEDGVAEKFVRTKP